jgi:hypothetical protein
MSTKLEGVPCYDKAGEREPVFVLRAQDILADRVVEYWATLAQRYGVPQARIDEARRCAIAMHEWQTRKLPD